MNTREILSVVLATAVVGLGLFAMGLSPDSKTTSQDERAGDIVSEDEPVTKRDTKRDPETLSSEGHVTPTLRVIKCEINGRTIYSDQACAGNGKVIELRDTAGINGDSQAAHQLAALAVSRPQRTQAAPRVTSIEIATQDADCEAANRRISQIESQARQPQSAMAQEWLKNEKTRLQRYAC